MADGLTGTEVGSSAVGIGGTEEEVGCGYAMVGIDLSAASTKVSVEDGAHDHNTNATTNPHGRKHFVFTELQNPFNQQPAFVCQSGKVFLVHAFGCSWSLVVSQHADIYIDCFVCGHSFMYAIGPNSYLAVVASERITPLFRGVVRSATFRYVVNSHL